MTTTFIVASDRVGASWSTLSSMHVALTTATFIASKLGECKSMHRRVVGLAASMSEEKIRGEMIKLNRSVYSASDVA
jgi:hypothetical protein